jgi:hypothetical protein
MRRGGGCGCGGPLLAGDIAAAEAELAGGHLVAATLSLDQFVAAVEVLRIAGAVPAAAAQELTAAALQIVAVIGVGG